MDFDTTEDVERARRWLRARLMRLARTAYPDTEPAVERDAGPLPVEPGPSDQPTPCTASLVVTTGAAAPPWDAAGAVRGVAAALAADGWTVGAEERQGDRHAVTGRRDGFTVVAGMREEEGILRLDGETPAFTLPPEVPPEPTGDGPDDGWVPANDVEAALALAHDRNDQENFFGLLSEVPLYLPPVDPVERDGRPHLVVRTAAPPGADWVVTTYRDLAAHWPDPGLDLAVDPDTPIEAYLPVASVAAIAAGEQRLPLGNGAPARPAGGAPAGLGRFQPANELERGLAAALGSGDRDALLDLLTAARVPVWAVPDGSGWRVAVVGGVPTIRVFTSPERAADGLGGSAAEAVRTELADVARTWPDRSYQLVINAGSPVAVTLPGFAVWALAEESAG